ncbi:hypothetical protein SDC9_123641 [bioreactor metagenome]|uniref:Uncharacterized protein n=1 Tax=bioreactor metagenome TaxID=1076179 RepID=A0A645CIN5_9ZZZZ
MHDPRLLHHENVVCQCWAVDRSACRGTHDDRQLGNDAARYGVPVENLPVTVQCVYRFLNPRSAAIVDADDGRAILHGQIHNLADLVCMFLAETASKDGEVLAEDIDSTTVNLSIARHNAITRDGVALKTKTMATMGDQLVEFDKGPFIKKLRDTIARCPLPLRSLLLYGLRSTALLGLGALAIQFCTKFFDTPIRHNSSCPL